MDKFKIDYAKGVAIVERQIMVDENGAYIVINGKCIYLNESNSETL